MASVMTGGVGAQGSGHGALTRKAKMNVAANVKLNLKG
jgi:hypothetical protein